MHWAEQNSIAEEALANARFTTSSGFARADCPFCAGVTGRSDRKQCLAISTTTGWYKCWRCGTKGRIDGEWDYGDAPQRQTTQGVDPPEGFLTLCEEPACSAMSADDARGYLCGRGLVDQQVWTEAGLGCVLTGKYANRVVVPVLSPVGEWWGWVSRLWSKNASDPYRTAPGMVLGPGMWNHAALLVETDEPALVVEGCFDGLPYWPDAVAALGKPKRAQVMSLVEAQRPIAVVLDGDSWEEAEMLALRLQFEGQRAGFVRLPPKQDPNSVDPAWLREEVRRCLM